MAQQKQGFLNKLIMGSEKSEGYARSTLPTSRWSLFWDIFKGRMSKLFIINLLMLLFILPLLAVLFLRTMLITSNGMLHPFSANLGLGYPGVPNMTGLDVLITNQVNMTFFAVLPIVAIIASIGISGGFYVIRNLVWTEGIFIANDFWKGIKLNFFVTLYTILLYSIVFAIAMFNVSNINYLLVIGAGNAFWLNLALVFTFVTLAFVTIIALYMLSMGVTYDIKFFKLIKNAFLFTIGLLPQNIFFILLGAIPMLLFLVPISFAQAAGFMVLIIFGFSFFTLVWTNFSHYAFDKFINDKIEGAVKNRGIYEKVDKGSESKAMELYKAQLREAKKDALISKPIKPITDKDIKISELPVNFNRADLEKLRQEKEFMMHDHESYVDLHKNDLKYKNLIEAENETVESPKEKGKK